MSPETKPVVHFSGSPRTERIEAGKLGLKMSYAVAIIELCQGGSGQEMKGTYRQTRDQRPVSGLSISLLLAVVLFFFL